MHCSIDLEKPQGFLWYKDLPPQKKSEPESQKQQQTKIIGNDAKLRNQALKKELDDAIQEALDQPTLTNAIKAQRIQNKVFKKSEQFSKVWMLAALLDPDLLKAEDNPNVLNNKLAKDEKKIIDRGTLQKIAKDWGLVFYVKEDCVFCERFAPIIAEFSSEYQFQVLAVSDSGNKYFSFKGAKDSGLIAKINPLKETPMLYMVHQNGQRIYPIARGLTDSEKIKDNILLVLELQKIKT